jgi:molecular chaperone DnaK (HSP70)
MPKSFLGIDFGTSTSSMARINPQTGQPEVLLNAEGEARTPSVVYLGDGAIVVGKHAEAELEDGGDAPRVVASIKRDIASARRIGGRTPVQIAAAILAKLKHDAEELAWLFDVINGIE